MQFASVWGAGQKTAERWWAEGCRSLDDVRLRTDLTEQQAGSIPFRPCIKGPCSWNSWYARCPDQLLISP